MSKCAELVLIPTEAERELCAESVALLTRASNADVHLCGWGLVQSAVLATQLILEYQPDRVWLVGIAGALNRPVIEKGTQYESCSAPIDSELQIGHAYEFGIVEIDGIGVGQGREHLSSEQLGWGRLFGGPESAGCRIELRSGKGNSRRKLLSVCSASANFEEAAWRKSRFLDALAEDMESYSVAVACHQMQVPLRVIRGISNRAGDRQHSSWKAAEAMRSALQLTTRAIQD